MFNIGDKRRIYKIIDMYLSGKIDEITFVNEFYYSYDLEVDRKTLNEEERSAFFELGQVAGRMTEFEEDILECPGFFYTKDQLKKKIEETRFKLIKYWPPIND